MTFAENTPEYRVHELSRTKPGLTDNELLTQSGWVPHDGTALRDDLITQYRMSASVQAWEEGLRLHSMDWACHGAGQPFEVGRAYGSHIVALFRSGDMTTSTSHKSEFPAFLAAHEVAQAEADIEIGA